MAVRTGRRPRRLGVIGAAMLAAACSAPPHRVYLTLDGALYVVSVAKPNL